MSILPNGFYQVEIVVGDKYQIGFGIPGFPFVLLGKTKYFGLGYTWLFGDQLDFYMETLSPDGKSYLYNGTYHDLRSKKVTIEV